MVPSMKVNLRNPNFCWMAMRIKLASKKLTKAGYLRQVLRLKNIQIRMAMRANGR